MAFLSGLAREGLPTWPHSQFAITRPCSQERQRDVSSGSCQTLLGLLSSKLASPGSPEPSPTPTHLNQGQDNGTQTLPTGPQSQDGEGQPW